MTRLSRHEATWAYILIGPWIVGFLVFTIIFSAIVQPTSCATVLENICSVP